MRSKLLATIAPILFPLAVLADDLGTFLCIPEAATGFEFNEVTMKWEQASLDVSGVKYLIKAASDKDKDADSYLVLVTYNGSLTKGDYVVRRFGDNEISYWCDSEVSPSLEFVCEGMGRSSFVFDRTAGRYVRSSHGSYINSVVKIDEDDWTLGSMLENFRNGKETAKKVADKGGNSPVIEIGQCSEI